MKHKQGFQKTYLWLKLFGGIFVLVGCCCQTISRHYIKKDHVKQSIAFLGLVSFPHVFVLLPSSKNTLAGLITGTDPG